MNNKTVLITGAAKRMGAAIAEHLHQSGMDIIIHHNTSEQEALALVKKFNKIRMGSSITVKANLEYQQACKSLINSSLEFNGNIDVLINNASVFYPTPFDQINNKQWDEINNINLKAPLFLSQLAAPALRKNNGCIINIADIHANRPLQNHSIYSISKAGLIMLTQALAKELAPDIRVNAISPGVITWADDMDEGSRRNILEHTAMKTKGDVENISKTVLFLIEDADYMTGQALNIDGGRTLY